MDARQIAMNKAKVRLMTKADTVFFTTICFSLKIVWNDKIPTACTDGIQIQFNTKFFMGLTVDEQVFLLVHEACHVAYMHMDPSRIQKRNQQKWNLAADYVINIMLVDRGFKMPKNGLINPLFRNKSTEQVYDLIPDSDFTNYDCDIDIPSEPDDIVKSSIQDIIIRASIQSKMQDEKGGIIPGEVQIFLNKLLQPKLPWFRILQKYIQAMTKNDYSFRKPNKRFFPKFHMPSLYSESLSSIAIAVDTSGSVSEKDFTVFISEVHGILKMLKPEKITLIQFDSKIQAIDAISDVNELSKVKFIGGGGTEISEVIGWTNVNKPQLLLVFTDGYITESPSTTKIDTLWVIHNNPNFVSSFGKVIHYDIKD